MGLTRMYLSSRYWRFGRADGSVIADRIRLRRDGTIEGHSHSNEARWGLDRNQLLVFYRQDGVATTRFGIERLSPKPGILKGAFLFAENITHTLTEKEKVPLPKHIKQLPWILLVRPNLGQPLLLSPDNLENFEITFAGTSEQPPHPNNLLRMLQAPSLSQPARITLTLAQNGASVMPIQPKEVVSVIPYSRRDKHDPPRTAREHQYKAGFRWEARVRVGLDSRDIVRLGAYGWPRMFDIKWWHRRKEPSFLYHSIYVSNLHEKSEVNFLHITDTHVARRNDLIPEVLSETRNRHEARRLRLRYNNFNDNLRAMIRFADKEKVDFIVVTGDLIDHYHDGLLVKLNHARWTHTDYDAGERGERGGWFGIPPQKSSNFREFVEIVTGQDGRGEALKCPIFCIPGNHDYLLYECPITMEAKLVGFTLKQIRRPDSYGLNTQEVYEFEFWKRKKGDSFAERKRRRRTGDKFEAPGCLQDCVLYTKPWLEGFSQYLTEISYDTDHVVRIGPHRLVCINTGEDVGIPYDYPIVTETREKHFLDDQSHNRGILKAQFEIINDAVIESKHNHGLALVFTHAPLVRERKPGDYDSSTAQWNMAGMILGDEGCCFHSEMENRNSIQGLDGATAEWDSNIPISMVKWLQTGASGVDAIFSGHSHDVREYRMGNGVQVCKGSYSADLSTTQMDKKEWLNQHHPLQFISGALKGSKREFREVVIINDHIQSSSMREILRLEQKDTAQIGFMFTKLSIDLAHFGGYTNTARNDLNPATHFDWSDAVYHRLAVMWDLMEKYWLQLRNIEYLENMLQSEGYARMPQYLRKKLERVDESLENASAQFARIAGRYPNIDWWYEPRDLDRRKSQFYAISTASLNLFGVDFSSFEKNSLDLGVHYQWSRDHWRSERLQDSLEERVGKLFEFAHSGALNLIAMWFASESVHLASWSSWDISARGSNDPSLHLRWALAQTRDRILDDLCEKYEIAAKHNYGQSGEAGLKEFYVYHSVRMAAWGASVGTLDEQPDKVYFEAQAARLKSITGNEPAWVDAVIKDIQSRVRRTGIPLVPMMPIPIIPPNQISPADGTVFSHYPRRTTLRWEDVHGATSYTVEVEYKYGNTWSFLKRETGIKATIYTFDFVGAQPGRWRVWGVGGAGQEGPKSGWWEFRYTR